MEISVIIKEKHGFSSYCVIWSSTLVQNFMPDLNELLNRRKKPNPHATLMQQSNLRSLNGKTENHHLNFHETINT